MQSDEGEQTGSASPPRQVRMAWAEWGGRGYPAAPEELGGVSLLAVIDLLLRRWRTVVLLPLLGALAFGVASLVRAPEYQAVSSFVLQTGQDAGEARIAGIAAQLGVPVGLRSENGESAEFYAQLIESRTLLGDLARTTFRVAEEGGPGDTLAGDLYRLFELEGLPAEERVPAMLSTLERSVDASHDVKTGLIRVQTRARWPELAVGMNRRLLELLGQFHLARRQARTSAERKFFEERLTEAQRMLAAAEQRLESFSERNRHYSSPQLQLEFRRLERRVELRQQVYLSLAQAHEQARIDEVRNTPIVAIVDEPTGPAVRRRRGAPMALAGFGLGGVLALVLVFGQACVQRESRENPAAFAEVAARYRRTVEPLRRLTGRSRPPAR